MELIEFVFVEDTQLSVFNMMYRMNSTKTRLFS